MTVNKSLKTFRFQIVESPNNYTKIWTYFPVNDTILVSSLLCFKCKHLRQSITESIINFLGDSMVSMNPFLHPLKTLENLWFPNVSRGYTKRPVAWNRLNSPYHFNLFKSCLVKSLLGPFFKTLSHFLILVSVILKNKFVDAVIHLLTYSLC